MAWGDPPHEGYRARLLKNGTESAVWGRETDELATGWVILRCSCGWRGGRYHDDLADADIEDRQYAEWRDTHMAPLVDPEPDRVLILAEDAGGPRHFLAGRPVHAGTMLELRLPDDIWVPVRYEWTWLTNDRPRAYLSLGGRGERLGWDPGTVDFPLPERAELRWPEET